MITIHYSNHQVLRKHSTWKSPDRTRSSKFIEKGQFHTEVEMSILMKKYRKIGNSPKDVTFRVTISL